MLNFFYKHLIDQCDCSQSNNHILNIFIQYLYNREKHIYLAKIYNCLAPSYLLDLDVHYYIFNVHIFAFILARVGVPHYSSNVSRNDTKYCFGVTEIIDFCEFLSPTPEEQASRTDAVQSVFEVVKYIWPHCKVCLTIFAILTCIIRLLLTVSIFKLVVFCRWKYLDHSGQAFTYQPVTLM